jgi:hypothetical protein
MALLLVETLPEICMAGTFHSHGGVALAVTVVGLLAAAFSLTKGFQWLREEIVAEHVGHKPRDRHAAKSWLLGAWVLVPSAWLYVEDIFLFRAYGKAECFASFQYAQEIVFRGWVVLVVALSVLYFGRSVFRSASR